MPRDLICIACSIFKKELEEIWQRKNYTFKVEYLDSMLHMRPDKLKTFIDQKILKNKDKDIIILYGDCQPDMHLLEEHEHVFRYASTNCCDMVIEKKRYRKLRKEGAFFLMPEWVLRWHEVFHEELGFSTQENARNFMQEMHTKFVYLKHDTDTPPYETLNEIARYFDLPVEIEEHNSNALEDIINNALTYFKYES